MAEATTTQAGPGRVGRLAARALLKLLDGLRASDTRVADSLVEELGAADAPLIDWPIDVGEPGGELSEEELLVLAELAEEQDDPFVAPLRPCRAIRRNRAWRTRRLTTMR
jgi:hypothetical protein